MSILKNKGDIIIRDTSGKVSKLDNTKPKKMKKKIKVPQITQTPKVEKKPVPKVRLRPPKKERRKKPQVALKKRVKSSNAKIKNSSLYEPQVDKKRVKYLIYNSVENVKNIEFPLEFKAPNSIPEKTDYTMGVAYESRSKTVSKFFTKDNNRQSFSLSEIMLDGIISTDQKRMTFKVVPGFKLEDSEDPENEELYWSKRAKPYVFVQLPKFKRYQILLSKFAKAKQVDISEIKTISSPEATITTTDAKIGMNLAQYGAGEPVQIKGGKKLSSSGIFFVKNHKVVAEISIKNAQTLDWNKIRKDAGADLVIEGKRSAYLGGKNAVSIEDLLDENKDIRYVHRGEVISLDRGLLQQHKSARNFLKKFNSEFLLEGIKVLSSEQ